MSAGQVHGLVLMLIAGGFIELALVDKDLVGRQKIRPKEVMVRLSKQVFSSEDGEYEDLALNDDAKWKRFTTKP